MAIPGIVLSVLLAAWGQEPAVDDLRRAGTGQTAVDLRTELTITLEHAELVKQAELNSIVVRGEYAAATDWAAFARIPFVHFDSGGTPDEAGLGDASMGVAHRFGDWKGLAVGAAFEFGLQTASDPLLGGTATTMRPSVAISSEFTPGWLISADVAWRRSLHEDLGVPDVSRLETSAFLSHALPSRWTAILRFQAIYDDERRRGLAAAGVSAVKMVGELNAIRIAPFLDFGLTEFSRDNLFEWRFGVDVGFYF